MATGKREYVKKLNEIAARYGKMEDVTIRQVQAMLKVLRSEIAAQAAGMQDFEAFRLRRLQAGISRLIDGFDKKAADTINKGIKTSHELGKASVAEPLLFLDDVDDEIKVEIERSPFFQPGPAQAHVALDYSTDLIKGLTAPMRAQIDKLIRLAILGTKKPIDFMRDITQILGVEARTGVWKKRKDPVRGVAARAETDLRTELQRGFNLSHHSQQLAAKDRVARVGVQLLKGWTANGDSRTRKSHLIAHLQYHTKPIPVDQPFKLKVTKGKNKGRTFDLMYPGDPSAPPELTVNCRCRPFTTTNRVGAIGSSLDGRIAQEVSRRGGIGT